MTRIVRIVPGDVSFTCEAHESVLDAAARSQMRLPSRCRSGTCGTCRGLLLAGEVRWLADDQTALSSSEIASGQILCCSVEPLTDLVIEVSSIQPAAERTVKKMRVRVESIESLAHDVVRLMLKLPDNHGLSWLPGQYIEIILPTGERRSFSIANRSTGAPWIELHIRNLAGGLLSGKLFSQVKEKSLLQIEGPLGDFYLRKESSRPALFVAGGTGFAPIKAIIEEAVASGVDRPMHLYWGVRALRDLYLPALPQEWARTAKDFYYVPVLSEPQSEDEWQGRRGFVHEAVAADEVNLASFDVYAAGPPVMVQSAHQAFIARGLPPEQFFSDPFEYARR